MGSKISTAIENNNERRRRRDARRQQRRLLLSGNPEVPTLPIRRTSTPAALELDMTMSTSSIDLYTVLASPTSVEFSENRNFHWLNQTPANDMRKSLSIAAELSKEQPKMIIPSSDLKEIDRMQREHYLLKYALKSNHTAPCKDPSSILEVGCGNGIWSLEIAQQYPSAAVIGLDILPPTTNASSPKNLKFVHGSILRDFDFPDDKFDFIYQRSMGTVIPSASWEAYLHEVWRILAPGGWLQLVEVDLLYKNPGPVLEIMNEWLTDSFMTRGIDRLFVKYLPKHLNTTGFINISKRTLDIPNGEWPSSPELKQYGFINKENQKIFFKVMRSWYTEELGIAQEDYDRAVLEAIVEFEEYQGYMSWTILTAQKPFDEEPGPENI